LSELVRVRKWKEFKRLAVELKPASIVYCIDQNVTSKTKELTCLRLILPAPNAYYVYVDFPKGNALRDTAIPVRENKNGRFLEDQDITKFLKKELGEGLAVFSYWTA
jgi:predicted ATP-dependent endonuclease of OLD family